MLLKTIIDTDLLRIMMTAFYKASSHTYASSMFSEKNTTPLSQTSAYQRAWELEANKAGGPPYPPQVDKLALAFQRNAKDARANLITEVGNFLQQLNFAQHKDFSRPRFDSCRQLSLAAAQDTPGIEKLNAAALHHLAPMVKALKLKEVQDLIFSPDYSPEALKGQADIVASEKAAPVPAASLQTPSESVHQPEGRRLH